MGVSRFGNPNDRRIQVLKAVLHDLKADFCTDAGEEMPLFHQTQRWVFLTDCMIVAVSNGFIVRKSMSSTLIPFATSVQPLFGTIRPSGHERLK